MWDVILAGMKTALISLRFSTWAVEVHCHEQSYFERNYFLSEQQFSTVV
jgi:hypothetical protein